MSNSSIWPIDRTLSGATTTGECGPQTDVNEGALRILQCLSIIGASLSDCLVLCQDARCWEEGLTPLQKCSWCILRSQPTRPMLGWVLLLSRDAVGVFCGHSRLGPCWGGFYYSAEMQSVYFTAHSRLDYGWCVRAPIIS